MIKRTWIWLCLAGCLWLMGCRGNEPSVSQLQQELVQDDWLVSHNAAELLAKRGESALPGLLKALKHKSPQVRMLAAEALAPFAKGQDSHARALTELLQALRDPHPLVRRRTAETLAMYAAHPVDTDGLILALLDSLRTDKDAQVRQYAARALGHLRVSAKNKSAMQTHVLPALLKHLDQQHPLVTVDVAYALSRLLGQQQALVRDGAKDEIRILANQQKQALNALIRVLRTADAWAKAYAGQVLGLLGARAVRAIPALHQALLSPKPAVYHNAATALGQIGEQAATVLKKDLNAASPLVRRRAAYALSQMRASAKDAVQALEQMLKGEKDKSVKAMAEFSRRILKIRHRL